MSSTPLLKKPRKERKAPIGKGNPGARCFLDAADLDSGIESVRQISPWVVWRSESEHVAMISELDYVIDVIKAASSQWKSQVTEAQQIAVICQLETTLSSSQGVPAKCVLMLADEIEKVFPSATTEADIQDWADSYKSVYDMEFEGMGVSSWCQCKLYPQWPSVQKHKITYEAKLEEFKGWVCKQSDLIFERISEKHSGGIPTMLMCLFAGVGRLVNGGHFHVIDRLVMQAKQKALPAMEKKATLKWSAFGPCLCTIMREVDLPDRVLCVPEQYQGYLEQVRDVVLPQFQFKLYQLKGLLEGQVKTVDSLKAKILAGMVSAAVASGQLAATYLTHVLQDQQ